LLVVGLTLRIRTEARIPCPAYPQPAERTASRENATDTAQG